MENELRFSRVPLGFKVGDRVRLIDPVYVPSLGNIEGTVRSAIPGDKFGVEWDTPGPMVAFHLSSLEAVDGGD